MGRLKFKTIIINISVRVQVALSRMASTTNNCLIPLPFFKKSIVKVNLETKLTSY
jgi:hypothetical protein